MNQEDLIKETIKYLNNLSYRIGEKLTEYDWRECCGLIKELQETFLIPESISNNSEEPKSVIEDLEPNSLTHCDNTGEYNQEKQIWLGESKKVNPYGIVSTFEIIDGPHSEEDGVIKAKETHERIGFKSSKYLMITVEPVPEY